MGGSEQDGGGVMSTIELKTMAPFPLRGLVGFSGLTVMGIGAGMLWGFGAALFCVGLFLSIDASIDESVERITAIRRGFS